MKPFFLTCFCLCCLLASCSLKATPQPSPTAAPLTITPPAQPIFPHPPRTTPIPTATNTRIPTLTYTYTPTQTLPPASTPTATSAPPLEPPGVLNRKDPVSLVRWLKYGLDHQDLSYIKPLLADAIRYSAAFTDLPGETVSRKALLAELRRRLPNHPACFSYAFHLGDPNYLTISTGGWNPPWEFDGAEWDYLLLVFSDQWTKEEGLYLYGAFVSHFPETGDLNETSCR